MRSRGWRGPAIAGGVLLVLLLLVSAAAVLIDEPLRRYIEGQMNARLDGYTVRIGRADVHPFGLSIDFEDLLVTQNAHPDPPVARIPLVSAGVQWRALLRGALVADFGVRGPLIHVNRAHFEREAADPRPVTRRGWQNALQAMYPLKINLFRVWDGQLTYVDVGPDARPLRLSQVFVRAGNIRNIESPDRVYPSHLWMEAVVFGNGRLLIDGNADFLAEPHLGVLARIRLDHVEIDYFRPTLARQGFALRRGTVSAVGNIEYAPTLKAVHLEDAVVRGLEGDYVHAAARAPEAQQTAAAAAKKVDEVANEPGLDLRIDRLRVESGAVGFVNRAPNPPYRVFLDALQLELTNFSNHFASGPGQAALRARFMGAGPMTAQATFRPERDGPDFDLDVRIENTPVTALNDVLRAYGKFDVVGGTFSFYSELGVKHGQISGYVKPLFRDLDVYDERQDEEKGLFRKMYEGLVGGVSRLLENVPRDEVATKAEVEGPVQDPRASTWQVLVRLVQNAFFKAILPGFDQEVGRRGRG
ncbi:MAG: DUF748 domain-containing protein [Candidatus Rokuibacteriota bacterium]